MRLFQILFVTFLTSILVSSSAFAESQFDGFYLGAQVGAEQLNSDNTGPRATGTRKEDDIGGLGVSGGPFFGYGKTFSKFYVGAELEADFSSTDPSSSKKPGGRKFSINKEYSFGASGRLGYVLDDNVLLYGRGGFVQSRFDTSLTTDIGATFGQPESEIGARFGVGAEIAATPNTFVRLDYTYTNYGGYQVQFTDSTFTGTDTFDNDETLFRVGLLYRFSHTPPKEKEIYPRASKSADFSGFYIGAQAGASQLATNLTGPRASSTAKDDELGDTGFAGGPFVGYGRTFNKFYFGIELEGNVADIEWVSRQEPGDRLTSVRKKYDVAGTLRGGYLINPSTLVYGRLGVAAARFNSFLRLGDDRTFNQSDTQIGLRVGVGGEVAATENLFVRLDYIYTRYNDYDLDFSSNGQINSGNRRIDNFGNEEMAFRIGAGYRFNADYEQNPAAIAKSLQSLKSGIKAGSFRFLPSLTVSERYDDNIFATRIGRTDDFITTISPYLFVKSGWTKHQLNLEAGADIDNYSQNENENTQNYQFGGDGRFDISEQSNVFGGGRFKQDHEDRESVNQASGSERTIFDDIQAHLGLLQKFSKVSVRAGGTFQRLDYDDVPSSIGNINNDDRDRHLYTAGARISHEVTPGLGLFVQGSYDLRNYDSRVDDNGFNRDSEGFRGAGGIKLKINRKIEAEVFAGYLYQDYEDPTLTNAKAPDYGALITWKMTPATTVRGYVDRTVEETVLFNASSYINTMAGMSFDHKFWKDLKLSSDINYFNSDFQGSQRIDDVISLGLGIKYLIIENIFVGTDYRFIVRNSNIANQNYVRNQGTVRIGTEF
jgi:hypothetical protein